MLTFQLYIILSLYCKNYFWVYIYKTNIYPKLLEIAIFEIHIHSSSFGLCTEALPKVLTNLLFTKIRYGNKYLCTISYFTICNFKFEYATCTATADQLHFDCRILTYFCYLAIHNNAKTFMKSHSSFKYIYPYRFTSFVMLSSINKLKI